MQQRITGFHQDSEQHWVADLACGHTQHVRHDPPWQNRPWVLEEATRFAHVGKTLNCVLCDAAAMPVRNAEEAEAYDEARVRGLCHDGAAEIARRRVDKAPE